MNALDTNILARFLIDDAHDEQAIKQREIVKKIVCQPCFISLTVILELVWVMYARYQLSKEQISELLYLLVNAPHITIEHEKHIITAIEHFLQGMDFADALHVAQVAHCQQFYTFDKKFIKKSQALNVRPSVIEPV